VPGEQASDVHVVRAERCTRRAVEIQRADPLTAAVNLSRDDAVESELGSGRPPPGPSLVIGQRVRVHAADVDRRIDARTLVQLVLQEVCSLDPRICGADRLEPAATRPDQGDPAECRAGGSGGEPHDLLDRVVHRGALGQGGDQLDHGLLVQVRDHRNPRLVDGALIADRSPIVRPTTRCRRRIS
jgi:hypothetical protein